MINLNFLIVNFKHYFLPASDPFEGPIVTKMSKIEKSFKIFIFKMFSISCPIENNVSILFIFIAFCGSSKLLPFLMKFCGQSRSSNITIFQFYIEYLTSTSRRTIYGQSNLVFRKYLACRHHIIFTMTKGLAASTCDVDNPDVSAATLVRTKGIRTTCM